MTDADREKVIKGLECISNGAKQPCRDCEYSKREEWCIAECAKDALALLKAREPVRVAVVNNSITGLPVTHCPKCHKSIDMFYAAKGIETKFCPWCGQAVKWG